ncbi:MAG: nuclear transport factor 2 family protein [Dehalococcoidales bacterium]|nr:nuclear transport factor 2 family protein [Dehalococcoidales bacterium]
MTFEELEKKISRLESLEKQVQALNDIEEIKQLHINYTYWLCNKQFEEMLDCFVDDAVANIAGKIFTGKPAIAEFFYNVLSKNNPRDGHITAQPVISVDGEKAHASWLLFMTYSEPTMRYAQGRQEADYVKVNGRWKMKTMQFIMPWPKA